MPKRQSTSLTLEDLARRYLDENDESARLFLRESWLSHVVSSLRDARVSASLTQKDLAERLNTTQSAIARLENDEDGSMSLRRVVDYALACGMSPFDLELASIEDQRAFAREHPDGIRTARAHNDWLERTQRGDQDNSGGSALEDDRLLRLVSGWEVSAGASDKSDE